MGEKASHVRGKRPGRFWQRCSARWFGGKQCPKEIERKGSTHEYSSREAIPNRGGRGTICQGHEQGRIKRNYIYPQGLEIQKETQVKRRLRRTTKILTKSERSQRTWLSKGKLKDIKNNSYKILVIDKFSAKK